MFARLRALLARRSGAHRPPPPAVAADDGGVTLRDAAGAALHLPWARVRRAAAYKRDLYATDAIILVLELNPPGPAVVELWDEWPGFAELFGAMERALGVSPRWYMEIMVPAFEPTPTLLYERDAASR